MSIQYLIPKPSVENAVNTGYKGTFIYSETHYSRNYYVLQKDTENEWWAIGMIAKVGRYDHPIIVSDQRKNVHTICDGGGGQSTAEYEMTYDGVKYYVSGDTYYATDTVSGSLLKNNIIPYYSESTFSDTEAGYKSAGLKLLDLYVGTGGSLPTRDYLIPEPQEIIDGTSVTKIYQSGEKNWWCAAKLGEKKYKWWAIGAIVTNTDGDNIPVIISNAEENCHLGSVSYSSDYGKYVFSVSSLSKTYYSFEQDGKTLYCSTSDYVAINDQKLLSTVPILGGSYDMSDENVIISVAKTIVGNYVNSGGTIPSAEIETDETYQKVEYTRINWENKSTSLKTPINESNLNKMDKAIEELCRNLDISHTESDVKKLDKSSANKLLSETPTWDSDTGILTFKFLDGTSFSVDFNIEKIPVSFSMDSAGVITMETADGTRWTADISKAIPSSYTFSNGARITFTETTGEDGTKKITADLVKGSITNEYLATDFLAKITSNVNAASSSAASAASSATDAAADAKLAQSYAIGGSGIRDGEDTDNAKYYAQKSAENLDYAKNLVTSGDDITE